MVSSSPEGRRVADAVARLRGAGERVTPARYAVLRVVDAADAADEHLTAEQIGGRVAQVEPSVHRATVYRTLTSLSEIGVLSHVHLGGSATVYHLAPEESRAPVPGHGHAHVQCHHCGRVFDVAPEAFDGVASALQETLGFTLDTSHAALLGTCRDCASAP
jgi:Fur family ferric uptake transcriptional regulator